MEFNTLYGYATNGTLKEWSVKTNGSIITVTHGKHGGKMQSKETFVDGKNVGRANETTPEEQAVLEAKSKWSKQVKKGYCDDPNNIVKLELAMLAMDYKKAGHRITFPAYADQKLDGVRCTAKMNPTTVYQSRGGDYYPTIEDINDELKQIFDLYPSIQLDGELYCHGMPLQDIVSAVKKHNVFTHQIEFHIFDIADEQMKIEERIQLLKDIESKFKWNRIVFIDKKVVNNEDDLKVLHDEYHALGYEGVMVRNSGSYYKFNHRSPDLQKYKIMLDSEFLCIGVETDKNGQAVLLFENFKASWKGTRDERQFIAQHPETVVFKYIKVQYQCFTNAGTPQFPIALMVRELDDDGNPIE